jgi:glycosyltransferase involved in cell wall biosynthesis
MSEIKKIDQYFAQFFHTLFYLTFSKVNYKKEKQNAFISVSNRIKSKTEDRTSIHFKLLSQADVDCKFFSIKIKSFLPGVYYAIKLSFFMAKYNCKILLFDYNFKTRFPNLKFIKNLKDYTPVICFWLETFDEDLGLDRILPTLKIIDYHIVTDDPSLRIKKYPKCKNFSDKFYYFPVPIIPEKMFYDYNSNEKKYDLCFYGSIENNVHRSEREKILNYLANSSYSIHGFSSKNRHDTGRPSYDEMLKGIRESRIGLNFSSHGHVGIVTNRVIEVIASGTVLLSSNEDVLQKLIHPESEYVYFVNELDLVSKIQDLLKNEEKMRVISKAASDSISSRYSAERFVLFIESLIN